MPEDLKEKHRQNSNYEASSAIRQSGFIAQEVEQAMKESGYDFNGLHKPVDENDNYSLALGQFVVPLVKAVQEQQAIIEQQEQRLRALEKKLDQLLQTSGGNTPVK
jgi:hypothetical protein